MGDLTLLPLGGVLKLKLPSGDNGKGMLSWDKSVSGALTIGLILVGIGGEEKEMVVEDMEVICISDERLFCGRSVVCKIC
jgi:hypothetical protein